MVLYDLLRDLQGFRKFYEDSIRAIRRFSKASTRILMSVL